MHARSFSTALVGLVLAAAPLAAQDKPAPKPEPRPTPAPAAAPRAEPKPFAIGGNVDAEISLPDLDGKMHKLADQKGKIVVIDFWSVECPVSKAYEDRLKKIYEDYSKKGVSFLIVDANKGEIDPANAEGAKRIREYLSEHKLGYSVLADRGNVVADRFAAMTTPHVFILDAKGVLRYSGAIDDDGKGEKGDKATPYVRQALDALLAGKEVPTATTKPVGCSIKRAEAGAARGGDKPAGEKKPAEKRP